MLIYLLIGIPALLIVAFIIFVAMRPSEFRIERKATMTASALAAFDQVNNFHKWEAWSPWGKLDPNAKNTYEGPETGVGANFRWDGNKDVGQGAMTILESQPGKAVKIKLEFYKPFRATNDVEFTFSETNGSTIVCWGMAGKYNFVSKIFGLFMNMDKMVGGKFEEGLASMKAIVEARK